MTGGKRRRYTYLGNVWFDIYSDIDGKLWVDFNCDGKYGVAGEEGADH